MEFDSILTIILVICMILFAIGIIFSLTDLNMLKEELCKSKLMEYDGIDSCLKNVGHNLVEVYNIEQDENGDYKLNSIPTP